VIADLNKRVAVGGMQPLASEIEGKTSIKMAV